jgi:hypothetical protein
MKRLHFVLFFILMLPACQSQPAKPSPVPTVNTLVVATSKPGGVSKGSSTPASLKTIPTPTQAPLHSSSSDPNAGNLVIVRDQQIVNNSLTIDSITAAKAGWVVLYLEKDGSPGHYICYVPVPIGKSIQFAIPLNQSSNIIVNPATLPGRPIDVVLQAGASAPGKPVSENGKMVWARFTIIPTTNP